MIPASLLTRLPALQGHLTAAEGERLAQLARDVPLERAIVEIGSYKGKSACYLGVGSRSGHGAPVFAIDLWELNDEEKYASPDVFQTWQRQIASFGLADLVTPLRIDASLLGRMWNRPIGLLFIDGDHDYESVARDFQLWSPHLAPGAVLAFHDYAHPKVGADVKRLVAEHVATSNRFRGGEIIDRLYVTKVVDGLAETQPKANGDDPRGSFVSNQELHDHLARRPAQYAFDLALIVQQRTTEGIYVDTESPHYDTLVSKYRDSERPAPIAKRLAAICSTCPIGAECRFPRLEAAERQAVLERDQRALWPEWCRSGAWGKEIDVVYPYVADAAEGDELRYSLRSLEQNLLAVPRVWVIGDKPAWYRGNHVPHRRLERRAHQARFDRADKLWKIIRDRRIGHEFVWMMDDVYLVQPVTLQELRQRYKSGEMDPIELAAYQPKNGWGQEKLLTWQALANAGRPIDDQAAHLPYVYEKSKLRALLKKYRLHQQPLVDNLLYCNEYATSLPRPCHEILYTESGRPAADEIRRRLQPALIMNHAHRGYTPAMREVLAELFPEPSRWEQ